MSKVYGALSSGLCALLTGLFVPPGITLADETAATEDDGKQLCVSLRHIRRTEIIDESNIVFYMNGGVIYLNTLPRKCNALRFNDGLLYRTSLSRLCNVDIITVLRLSGGDGFTAMGSCGLGKFKPVSEEQVAALKGNNSVSTDKSSEEESQETQEAD